MDVNQFPILILPDINLGFHPRDSVLTPVFTPDALGVILKNHYCRVILLKVDIDIFRNQPNCLICSLNGAKKIIGDCINAVLQSTD